ETQRSERDWQANPTVLSGDIDGNDTTDTNGVVTDTANITGTNSYHVVTGNDADTNSVLDGFHITAGDATNGLWSSNYPDEPTSGGGMYNYDGSATLTQLIFSGNLGDGGGGMYNTGGASQFITVTFINNSSTGSGGGLATYDNNPILQNVVFSGNAATADGGGLFSDGSPTLTNVIFSGNVAGSSGGGIMNDGSGLSLINVSLSGNRANSGGGIYNNYSNSSVYNSILWNNQDSSGTGTITATIYNNNSAITLTHSLVQGSGGSGSWIADTNYVDGGGNLDTDPWFVTPVSPTTAPTTTGNLRLQSVSPAIDVGDNQYITTTTDLDGNPRVADGDWSNTATVDMGAYEYQQPCPTGPAVRVDQTTPTPGLGETWASAVLNPQNGLAIAVGCSGITEIWVATGVYTPGANVTDTFQLLDDVALYGGFAGVESERNARDPHANPTVLSGDIAGDDTTNANGVVTATANISGTNSYHVVTGSGVTVTARLDGFSITAGQANGGWVNPCGPACGGGMYNESGSPTLANLSFSGNWAGYEGGGIYNRDNSSPGLTKVSFSGNTANNGGGGMYNYNNSSPGLMDVSFSDNSANNGGGMYNYNASPIVIQAHIFGNSATNSGGGMYNYNNSNPSLVNVSFSGNSAANGGGMCNFLSSSPSLTNISFSGNSADDGGGMYNYGSNPNLTNISFSGNLADYGGGMYNRSNSAPQVYNSVLWNNQDSSGVGTITATIYNDRSAITLTHSLVQGSGGSANWTTKPSFVDGGNNIDADPLFATPISPTTAPTTTGDLHLLPGSPAIDSGLNSAITATTALDGNVRIQDGDADGTATVDMGAYEAPTHYRLTVAKAGNGAGQVSGQPAGIDCGLTCTLVLEQHSAITLSAAADSGSTFTEWSGAGCSGTGDCVVTMDAATQVTATFTLNTYTLDVSKDGDGGGTVSSTPSGIDCGVTCTQDYDYGTVVTLTAAADPGSTFTSWSGTGCSGAGDCVVTMDAAKQVTATFTLVPIGSHALTVLKDGDGGGIVSSTPAGINCGTDCSEIFIESTTVTLTAMASGNSTFDSWSGAGCSGAGDCVVTMDAAKQVTATFTLNTYTLDVSKDGSGSGTVSSTPSGIDCGVSCTQDYVHGTLVTLTVVADSGSTFTSWSGAGCSGAGDCVVTMDAAKQVTATFTLIPAGSHALTVLKDGDGGGIVSSTPAGINCGTDCSEIFIEGTTVTLTAMASGNATFGGWSGAGCGGTADCVVTMDAAKQVTATFTLNTYTTLDVLKDGDGGGTVSSTRPGIDCGADCTQDYIHGTVVTLTVVADSDSTFSGWSGAGCGGLDDCVVTMDASKTVTAAFDLLPVVPTTYTLTLATDGTGSGSVTPDPVGTLLLSGWLYEQGAVVTLTAVPALGSYFGGWTGDLLTADSIENLVMDGNKQVTATFSTEPPVTYTLTVQTVGNGSVSPAGGTYISGTAVILMATPDTGWQFEGWSGDVVSTNNPLNVTMTRDVSVTATFNQSGGYDYIYLPLLLRNG
ncbi:MAG: hypothetical protein GY832_17840, partial [Chloroflexi bacterium]|nr:hypothetical protein [Chloroflexota bacterium]